MRRSIAVIAIASVITAAGGPASALSSNTDSIVGRWQQNHTCQQLVDALQAEGLGEIAPGVVGDYFPDQTPEELAAKPDLCAGARPQQHSHWFTSDGGFGSLDQYWNVVDENDYVVVDANTIRIGEGTFDFSIQGDLLSLRPRISVKQRREALRDPLAFSTAGWMVAVSYPGTTWKGVPCSWC